MSIDRLKSKASLPVHPHCIGRPQWWKRIEDFLGTTLPSDYKDVINSYGYGRFGSFIIPYNPFVAAPMVHNLILSINDDLKRYQESQEQFPDGHPPFPTFPSPGGLLPWGTDEASGTLCWLTDGSPDQWTIVVLDEHFSEEYMQFDLSTTEFLVACLSGDIEISIPGVDATLPPEEMFESLQPDPAVC